MKVKVARQSARAMVALGQPEAANDDSANDAIALRDKLRDEYDSGLDATESARMERRERDNEEPPHLETL